MACRALCGPGVSAETALNGGLRTEAGFGEVKTNRFFAIGNASAAPQMPVNSLEGNGGVGDIEAPDGWSVLAGKDCFEREQFSSERSISDFHD